ncbi:MAG: hypothetical protein U0790_06340 [Isosphaeraceae bacterium]
MSTRKTKPSRHALRPSAESLEGRQLLSALSTHISAQVSGVDPQGDRWTLTLYGPGTMNVVDENGQAFTRANQNDPREINTITVSGTITATSRLVGRVTPGASGDGKVFFQTMNIEPTGAYSQIDDNRVIPRASTPQNGISAVDMPHFWLGHTSTTEPTFNSQLHSGFFVAGAINAAEGIQNLRFGGVDTTFTPTGGTPLNQSGQRNEFLVNLGLPISTGTSIIVDRVITDAQLIAASGTATTGTVNQQSVTFLVAGRLNLFQANSIDGNTTPADTATRTPTAVPSQFSDGTPLPPTPPTPQPGGTYVVSIGTTVTGQIGDLRIGGNATNLTAFALTNDVFAAANDVSLDPRFSNFFVGGETNNVLLIAPGGSRNVYFGLGMDNVKINSRYIQNLQANRGAVNSSVTVERTIDNMIIGGDLIDSNIQVGYLQTLHTYASSPASGQNSAGGAFNGQPVPDITNRIQNLLTGIGQPLAHGGGGLRGRIAGNVTNSIVSASVNPDPSGINDPGQFQLPVGHTFAFGAPENIVLPHGVINVKVEGRIDNSGLQSGTSPFVDPNIPSTSAFFAKQTTVKTGPVIPPNVPSAPYAAPTVYHKGQRFLKGLFKRDGTFRHRVSR